MTRFRSDFLRTLDERGFIHQISDPEGLDALALKGRISGYVGYDATATSIHIGNLISVTMLYWLQETGHQAISLMGGGTSMVGDPSFRDDQRKLLTVEQIETNIESIKRVYGNILNYGGSNPATMVNNADWLLKLNYVEFLRDVGRHFSVNRMLSFDSVKLRLDREQSLSFLEFNYMIMQGYDFTELNRRYGTVLQMGGSDQWGNIINGVDLSHRMGGPQLYALTTPLLTKASGEKMGKSASGAVWLNGDLFSAYDFWQYFRNTEDADVGKFLKIFTRLPLDEIAKLAALGGNEINEAKKVLATEVTAIVHGRAAAEAAAETARKTFEEGALADTLPSVDLPPGSLAAGLGVLNAAVTAGLVASTGEARRQIKGGGLRINDTTVTDERAVLTAADLTGDGVIKISLGRKKHVLLRQS
ncbi:MULTISPECIES: tyrosine--tRNA ligase [unclassified Chelatococcus]|uniref:tyrosine--tRNA ligase n=1 Tax=unclassified Chelatococcus TaxID=2638111 RepID=UPI001BCE155F|nr:MULTISPECIES: tyrosine--tRNA ligase [unclassified Chelatococcus]CAH1672380.1 Tyrosine--tRNA ligase [Hyphomicrobiales bacterium]MBS7738581.1 tyrosine--tRNA ligase [Chelatococcus sp. HY11]MBX3542985.1 tyrosine--tRNA ligase [Chelatococcus sp.]MCO5076889.1 tyrosine--tRNA ligase [Chelatococcus sp.]CAH1675385.1 Tyrosine--tRNA ligase [Hyphomicrobiales bacterium]